MSDKDDEKDDKPLELDSKTAAVFVKKGYTIEKKLNEGAFGQVFKGKMVKTGQEVAIKVMFLAKLGPKYTEKFWPRELTALMNIRHEHIIAIHDIIRAGGKLFIFMEFANGGDITGYLKKNGPMAEALVCYWFTQCSRAMAYMHDEHKYAHRDMKIDNVLLHNNRAKVTDFGFARMAWDKTGDKVDMSTTFCGTAPYYSPQIFASEPYNPFAADCWAMGVMLFAMLNNKYPFHYRDAKECLKEQTTDGFIRTRFIKEFPLDLIHLHERFFAVDEKDRINMAEVLKHPWIIRKGKPDIRSAQSNKGSSSRKNT